MRTNFDLTPYRRSTVGFDRLFDWLQNPGDASIESAGPPFDLERVGEDSHRITLAVAGYRPDEIELVAQQNLLVVTGRRAEQQGERQYLHRGIPSGAWERRFQLADFVQVKAASLADGLLTIDLKREIPEAMKPRKIEIGGTNARTPVDAGERQGSEQQQLEHA